MKRPVTRLPLLAVALLLLPACQERLPVMLGEHNVLVVAPTSLWDQVEDSLDDALVASSPGMLPERTFRFMHRTPDQAFRGTLQGFRQVLLMGFVGDSLVDEALRQDEPVPSAPALVVRSDLYRPGHEVVVLALPEAGPTDAALDYVADMAAALDGHYRSWTARRMYAGGLDPDLVDSLAASGFELAVPAVYAWRRVSDSTFWFASQQNDLDRLMRSVMVTWRPMDGDEPSASSLLDWRQELADRHYEWGQQTQDEPLLVRPLESPGSGGIEARGLWHATVDGRPHGAPFLARVIDCPHQNRRYLLDAWVFAPNRGKYRYLIQLETLLDSFDCPSP